MTEAVATRFDQSERIFKDIKQDSYKFHKGVFDINFVFNSSSDFIKSMSDNTIDAKYISISVRVSDSIVKESERWYYNREI